VIKRAIIGFDVDGVIAIAPLGLHNLLRKFQRLWNVILKSPIGALVYRHFRFPDKDVKDLICSLYSKGYGIIIITYALGDGQKKAIEWLKENGVPLDKAVAPKEGENPLEFKCRAIAEENCDFFVEDQAVLAQGISEKLQRVRVIHYRSREDLSVLKELS
jgi:hypothetical protein